MEARHPARVYVLLARKARVGIVIRRGPSNHVATLLWNRDTDEVMLGQWVKARIYEERCDISPDGKYFIYFAMDWKWNSEYSGTYTAISRVPYLKALSFYPKGDTWGGGGLFRADPTVWIDEGSFIQKGLRESSEIRRAWKSPLGMAGVLGWSAYSARLVREGWKEITSRLFETWHSVLTYEKSAQQGWTLRKLARKDGSKYQGKGGFWEEHVLINTKSGEEIACPDWEWADLDGKRLVWATKGRLETGKLTDEGLVDIKVIYDFNDMTFEAVEGPY